MSASGDSKRKRTRDADADDTTTRKQRRIEKNPTDDSTEVVAATKSRGASRQEKSERRSKKVKTGHKDEKNRIKETKQPPKDEISNAKPARKSKPPKVLDQVTKPAKPKTSQKSESTTKSSTRFIVFVGNLPYDATTEQIEKHFVKLAPVSIRLRTDKATGRGKGFAFVEFDGFDKMKTCLKLYHHSIFDPLSKTDPTENATAEVDDTRDKKRGRKINVELTAGGGGKSQDRKQKISQKNQKLGEERERRREKEKEEQEKAVQEKREHPGTGSNSKVDQTKDDRGTIHPSRMNRVKN